MRMLVIKHLYGWRYDQTCQRVSGSLVLRQCCRVYRAARPRATPLLRWANVIRPATLQTRPDQVVDVAHQHPGTRGRKLRSDGTLVATNSHSPVDRTLLGAGLRVLPRTILRAKVVLPNAVPIRRPAGRNRSRRVRQVLNGRIDAARRRGEGAAAARHASYRRLVGLTPQVVTQAQHLAPARAAVPDGRVQRRRGVLQRCMPRVPQVIRHTTRRVLQGEQVPARAKLASSFEPPTAIIRTGKRGKPTAFGRVVSLDEGDGGRISRAAVRAGNPAAATQLKPSRRERTAGAAERRPTGGAAAAWPHECRAPSARAPELVSAWS